MNKIIAIAAEYQHLRNYCREKNIDLNRFVHATCSEKMRGLKGFRYIVVSQPYSNDLWHKMQIEFRRARAIRLPLDINQWTLTEFA
ncbi:MAG: hypothetical protein KAS93_06640 [Gammaproteobacteria bacterium]|nr:hypothetical protein [Gammaproteobacteria bacterium]